MKVVRTVRYVRDLKRLRLSAGDIDALERSVVAKPEAGPLIQGLRGVRKMRFRIGNRSKSSGGRAIYYLMMADGVVLMITAYAKAEKEDLSPDDRKMILRMLEEFKR